MKLTAKLISAFVFATGIVQFLFYLNLKFQPSSSFLCLYRPVSVGPVRKPYCWFSHEAAHMNINIRNSFISTKASSLYLPLQTLNWRCDSLISKMSRLVGKPTMWFPNRSDTNRPVQAQKRARSLKFWI